MPLKVRHRRVLVVSSRPLFGSGLRSLLTERHAAGGEVVLVNSLDEAAAALDALRPDLVVVDSDDPQGLPAESLLRFFDGEWPLQLVVLSLTRTGPAEFYEHRRLPTSDLEHWLRRPGSTASSGSSGEGERS